MSEQKIELELIASGLKVIADVWTLLIIETLRDESLRFLQIQKKIEINTQTLTLRLRKLEGIHFIKRKTGTDKQAVFYELTQKGKKSLVILDMIKSFTKENL